MAGNVGSAFSRWARQTLTHEKFQRVRAIDSTSSRAAQQIGVDLPKTERETRLPELVILRVYPVKIRRPITPSVQKRFEMYRCMISQ